MSDAIVTVTGPEWEEAIAALREAQSLAEAAIALERAAKARVQELMGPLAVVDGYGARIYWTYQPGERTIDKNRLTAEHPDIDLGAYERTPKPRRSFRAYFHA